MGRVRGVCTWWYLGRERISWVGNVCGIQEVGDELGGECVHNMVVEEVLKKGQTK